MRKKGGTCITLLEEYSQNMLTEEVLQVDISRYIEENWPLRDEELEKNHKFFRSIAYQRCSRWSFGILGKKQSRPFPACILAFHVTSPIYCPPYLSTSSSFACVKIAHALTILLYFGFMSDTFFSDSSKDKVVIEQNTVEKSSILLSEYVKGLDNHVRCRYMQKTEAININPATLDTSHLDSEYLPPIEAGDLVSYLVLETSFYTLKQFKNFKSLQAYNQVISGFVMSIQGQVILDMFVVICKVCRSQKMNDPLIKVWIITNKEGVIASADCFDCLAGLAESCSHIASILFYIEACTQIHGKLACTQVKCTWLLPTYIKEGKANES